MSIATRRLPLLARQSCHVRAFTVARAQPPLKSFAGRYQSTYSQSRALSKTLRPLSLAPFRTIATQVPAMSIDQKIPDDVLYPAWKPPTKGFLSLLPLRWVPYAELMRLEKTGGLYGFFFPYLIGIGFAASVAPVAPAPTAVLSTTAIFLAWNVLLRGSVCTINDNFDREFDRQVARCRTRPIARGAVTPLQGHVWFAVQTVAAFGVVTQLPHAWDCFYYAVPIHFLLSVYPLAKRVTDFPQVVLCVPLAGAVFMSSAAFGLHPLAMADPALTAATSLLFGAQALWIIMLDYVNACQDTVDDIKAGVRSMAVRYQSTGWFITTFSTAQIACMVGAGLLSGMSPVYFTIACGGNALMLAAMAYTVDRKKPKVCAWWFLRGSILVGGCTVLGLFAEYLMRLRKEHREKEKALTETERVLA